MSVRSSLIALASMTTATTMAFVSISSCTETRAGGVLLAHARKSKAFVTSILREESARVLIHCNGRQLVNPREGTIGWQGVSLLRSLAVQLEEENTGDENAKEMAVGVVLSVADGGPRLAVDLSKVGESLVLEQTPGLRLVRTRELMSFGTREAVTWAGRAQALLSWHGALLHIRTS